MHDSFRNILGLVQPGSEHLLYGRLISCGLGHDGGWPEHRQSEPDDHLPTDYPMALDPHG